ncbi:hypothetical protein N7532_009867 [Penicillium argentinense]|uniref:Gfo/Idh/MocA-like oxidoreductase N-terminal domain-containing protein n=1 Tax=Penicillium argentinense TaxID=1131581 RepID=A0A9W9JXK7_9EURO|nr:uncharacterized protein N7532_009867 [Penicillium argentinense]KAJ5085096.1 hypothetical protein N7532_009867 [Penicillium argentinense]
MNAANDRIAELRTACANLHVDQMVAQEKSEVVIVTTIDRFHHVYCIRAMELGCDVITVKPMTIDDEKLQLMTDAEKRTGKQIREVIDSGLIGEIATVHMDWILDCIHGSDLMRRWHREQRE